MPKYKVIKRIADHSVTGVQMGEKHKHDFIKDTSFDLPASEAAKARDIRQRFGQDRTDGKEASVLVAEIPDRSKKIISLGFGPGKWDEIRAEKERERENKKK